MTGGDIIATPSIWVIIPAFNESSVIAEVVHNLQLLQDVCILVVDDGSEDATYEKARSAGALVCRHIVNIGQGAALQTGFEYALNHGAEVLVTFDADGQHFHGDLPHVIGPILRNECDVVLGSRFLGADSVAGIPIGRYYLLKIAVFIWRNLLGLKITDIHNGFRAFSKSAASNLKLRNSRMYHATEILEYIGRRRLHMIEVPVHIHYSAYSLSKGQSYGDFLVLGLDHLLNFFRQR